MLGVPRVGATPSPPRTNGQPEVPRLSEVVRAQPVRLKEVNMGKNGGKTTSAAAARAASKVLSDGRTSAASKTAAASALSQRPSSGKKSK